MHKEVPGDTIVGKTGGSAYSRDMVHWEVARRYYCSGGATKPGVSPMMRDWPFLRW